ncbi:HIRAN domain-containing protein [Phenylobacterium sp.]|uniref:HIRAN domain-containing protein n=1 Tax=Phenylobacterium sp. TaxID=1871053 RepID=UPI00273751E6|nr:HIRAN domain-containing protein [Phenylobacterium sp.]MDP3853644.1 hypothetical protein [Phenylobacterium sp.]
MTVIIVLLILLALAGLFALGVGAALSHVEPSKLDGAVDGVLRVSDGGMFAVDVVGEGYYQGVLGSIVGGKTEDSVEHACTARIIAEPDNAYDANAQGVWIKGQKVGHLSRADALALARQRARSSGGSAAIECRALVVGGWKTGRSEGHFGVRLDLPYDLLGG